MATVFENVSIRGLRRIHFEQLLSYLEDNERQGWYYGNKAQFEKRHEELKAWLNGIIDYADRKGVIIPK